MKVTNTHIKCPSFATIEKLVEGTLSDNDETRELRNHILECVECHEIYEVLAQTDILNEDIAEINAKIDNRAAEIVATKKTQIIKMAAKYAAVASIVGIGTFATIKLLQENGCNNITTSLISKPQLTFATNSIKNFDNEPTISKNDIQKYESKKIASDNAVVADTIAIKTLITKASLLLEKQNYEQAKELIEEILELVPDNDWAKKNLEICNNQLVRQNLNTQ